jgi:hypothetical protein
VNCFKPLGHSGHPKLHAVVGSMESEKGFPHKIGVFVMREKE